MKSCSIAILLLLVGCSSERDRAGVTTRPRADASPDGTTEDIGLPTRDAGTPDGTPPPFDGGHPDVGFPDAESPDIGFPDTGTPDSGSIDVGIGIPYCQKICTVPADCVGANSTAVTDADNWSCSGRCSYLGCLSTPECTSAYGADYVCVLHPGLGAGCVKACNTIADCAIASSPLFDNNNYLCTSGGCQWLGCIDSSECVATYNDSSYVCHSDPNLPFDNCVQLCATPADCATTAMPAYDTDNYNCNNSHCEYLGCNSAAECNASFQDGTYVCE